MNAEIKTQEEQIEDGKKAILGGLAKQKKAIIFTIITAGFIIAVFIGYFILVGCSVQDINMWTGCQFLFFVALWTLEFLFYFEFKKKRSHIKKTKQILSAYAIILLLYSFFSLYIILFLPLNTLETISQWVLFFISLYNIVYIFAFLVIFKNPYNKKRVRHFVKIKIIIAIFDFIAILILLINGIIILTTQVLINHKNFSPFYLFYILASIWFEATMLYLYFCNDIVVIYINTCFLDNWRKEFPGLSNPNKTSSDELENKNAK